MAKRNMPERKKPMIEPDVKRTDRASLSNGPDVRLPEDSVVESVADVIRGKVIGCEKLNVRSKPNVSGEIRCTVLKNETVEIDEKKSTSEWYHVTAGSGVKGYCMRKYVGLEK